MMDRKGKVVRQCNMDYIHVFAWAPTRPVDGQISALVVSC